MSDPGLAAEAAWEAEQDATIVALRDLCGRVHRLRQARDEAKRQWDAAHEAMMLTLADLQGQLSACLADCKTAEAALHEATVAFYRETGNKRPIAGVAVRVLDTLVYDDAAAKAWAVEHRIEAALKLDVAGFERNARANKLPFVTHDFVPQATISKDLAAVIAAEEQMP